MTASPIAAFFDAAWLAFESQQVMALRCMRLAMNDSRARRESVRMVQEKVAASSRIGLRNAIALAQGESMEDIGAKTVSEYRKIVRRNRKRLSR